MYEILFAERPTHQSSPAAFAPGSGSLSFQVAAPNGCSARLSVLTPRVMGEAETAARLSSGATGLALAPIRVFPVGLTSGGAEHAQAYGVDGAVVLTFDSPWVRAMPAPPPAEGEEIEIEVVGLPSESGVLAARSPVPATLKSAGRRIAGWLSPSAERVSFTPDPSRDRVELGVRATFLGEFVRSSACWELRCSADGVATGPGVRGSGKWVHAGGRVGLSLELGALGRISTAAAEAESASTLETGTLNVRAEDILESGPIGTVVLGRKR
jgi:hypothetical protein